MTKTPLDPLSAAWTDALSSHLGGVGSSLQQVREALDEFVKHLATQGPIFNTITGTSQIKPTPKVRPEQSPPIVVEITKRRHRQTRKQFPFVLTLRIESPWARTWVDDLHAQVDTILTDDLGAPGLGGRWLREGGTVLFRKREHASALGFRFRGVRLDTPSE